MVKIIVLNIAGLSPVLIKKTYLPNINNIMEKGTYSKMIPSFPALTCSVQSTLLTGKNPSYHGIVGNGYFDKITMRPEFWRQESALVECPRIWDIMRKLDPKYKIAVLFWQNTKYIDADFVITPSPIHTDTGVIEWCYSKPTGLYESIVEKFGEFNLMNYWGPFSNRKSSDWITNASLEILKTENPDMMLVYIPHLDYVCQRLDPEKDNINNDLLYIDEIVGKFLKYIDDNNIKLFIISEYGFTRVNKVIYLNRILRENKLLRIREIKGREYIDFEQSDAFAIVDSQIAHIYCRNKYIIDRVVEIIKNTENISSVIDKNQQINLKIDHNRSGDLIALANKDSWFAYYYWLDDNKSPFYANNVDIHNKPGYDPCELFIDFETKSIPIRPELVKGSHGLPYKSEDQLAIMICSEKLQNSTEYIDANRFLRILMDNIKFAKNIK